MTLDQMLENVRVRTGGPRSQAPSDRTLILLLSTQIQNFLVEANLTGHAWAVDELTLIATPNTEEYPLPIDAHFGKPLQVRTIHPANSAHVTREVDFTDIGDLSFDWPWPRNFASAFNYDGAPHSAARIAFYRKSGYGQIYARIVPLPTTAAEYRVLYQVGVYGETTALDEIPLLPEHHALIEVRTALAVLPHCEWDDDRAINADRRKELALSLVPDAERLERNFKAYITSVTGNTGMSIRYAPVPYD